MPSAHTRVVAFPVWLMCVAAAAFGQSASPALRVPGASQPQLAVSSDDAVWLVYGKTQASAAAPMSAAHAPGERKGKGSGHGHGGAANRPDGDVFITRSDDGGATFAAAVKVATVPKLMLGRRRGPRVAAHGDEITVTLIAQELLAFASKDRGRTWTGPITINDVPTSAREGLHDLAVAPSGERFVTWLDLRNGRMELWGASSRDGGASWGRNEMVYRSPDKSICECCHPSALFDPQGNLAVMWRNSIAGARDLWLTTRPSGNGQFTAARKLGEGTWKLDACPMDGGRIVAFGGGKFGAVWQRAGDVFFAPAEGGREIRIGKGTQPVVVVRGGETTVFWQQGPDLMVVRDPGRGAPEKHASHASFATAVVSRGERGTLLAYEQLSPADKALAIVVERL